MQKKKKKPKELKELVVHHHLNRKQSDGGFIWICMVFMAYNDLSYSSQFLPMISKWDPMSLFLWLERSFIDFTKIITMPITYGCDGPSFKLQIEQPYYNSYITQLTFIWGSLSACIEQSHWVLITSGQVPLPSPSERWGSCNREKLKKLPKVIPLISVCSLTWHKQSESETMARMLKPLKNIKQFRQII